MSLKKKPMPSQEADVRNKNFDEVALGYTKEQAIDEAKRCLNCKNKPCVGGCPVKIYIPEFGKTFIANDTGGAIKGNKIDIFMNTKKECYNWGRRTIEIQVLN